MQTNCSGSGDLLDEERPAPHPLQDKNKSEKYHLPPEKDQVTSLFWFPSQYWQGVSQHLSHGNTAWSFVLPLPGHGSRSAKTADC